MGYKFKEAACTICGANLEAGPAGNIHEDPEGLLLGYCPVCFGPQPVVEDKPEPPAEEQAAVAEEKTPEAEVEVTEPPAVPAEIEPEPET